MEGRRVEVDGDLEVCWKRRYLKERRRKGKRVVDGGSSWHSKRRRAGDGLVGKREKTREGRKN